jgi:hypothetical protein
LRQGNTGIFQSINQAEDSHVGAGSAVTNNGQIGKIMSEPTSFRNDAAEKAPMT